MKLFVEKKDEDDEKGRRWNSLSHHQHSHSREAAADMALILLILPSKFKKNWPTYLLGLHFPNVLWTFQQLYGFLSFCFTTPDAFRLMTTHFGKLHYCVSLIIFRVGKNSDPMQSRFHSTFHVDRPLCSHRLAWTWFDPLKGELHFTGNSDFKWLDKTTPLVVTRMEVLMNF